MSENLERRLLGKTLQAEGKQIKKWAGQKGSGSKLRSEIKSVRQLEKVGRGGKEVDPVKDNSTYLMPNKQHSNFVFQIFSVYKNT